MFLQPELPAHLDGPSFSTARPADDKVISGRRLKCWFRLAEEVLTISVEVHT